MVVANEFDERRGVRLPILGETFKILENRVQASRGEDCHCILGVFVEIGVEDAHVLKVGIAFNFEEVPAQVVQFEHGKNVRLA